VVAERNEKGRFTKGHTPFNLSPGRPKGLAALVREKTHNGADLVGLLLTVALDDKADTRDRLSATNSLLDRGFGKAVQPIDGDGEGGALRIRLSWGDSDSRDTG